MSDSATHFTPTEARLLACLASHEGQAVSREQLLTEVWGYSPYALTRTIDTTVRRVRKKIEPNPSEPRYLLTRHGVGYALVDCHKVTDLTGSSSP